MVRRIFYSLLLNTSGKLKRTILKSELAKYFFHCYTHTNSEEG